MKKKISESMGLCVAISPCSDPVSVIGVLAYNMHLITITILIIFFVKLESDGVLGLMNVLITVIITSLSAAFSCQFKSEQMNLIKVAFAFY